MAKVPPKTTVSINGVPLNGISGVTIKTDANANVQASDNIAWFSGPNPCVIGPAGLGDPDPLACLPSMPNVKCSAGHRALPECTEYIDGEMISVCGGCGERIILPRVPGAVPLLRLNAFIETLVDLANGREAVYDDAHLLFEYAELKRAIETETDVMSRLHGLLDIAERLIKAKLAAPPSE